VAATIQDDWVRPACKNQQQDGNTIMRTTIIDSSALSSSSGQALIHLKTQIPAKIRVSMPFSATLKAVEAKGSQLPLSVPWPDAFRTCRHCTTCQNLPTDMPLPWSRRLGFDRCSAARLYSCFARVRISARCRLRCDGSSGPAQLFCPDQAPRRPRASGSELVGLWESASSGAGPGPAVWLWPRR
jgi:hypothetical protein